MQFYSRKPKGQRGLDFEDKFVRGLNGKRKTELKGNLPDLVSRMFPGLGDQDMILAQKADPRGKSDVSVFTPVGKAEISLKSLNGDIVHSSPNEKFMDYLRNQGMSEASIQTILLYLYRDGTTDGSGGAKWPYEETMYRLSRRIADLNAELNENPLFVQDILDLALFRGNFPELPPANWLYHGSLESGIIVSRYQVSIWAMRVLKMDFVRNPHIGPLHIRPYIQNLSEKAINRDKVDWLRLKWVGMDANLQFIKERIPVRKRR